MSSKHAQSAKNKSVNIADNIRWIIGQIKEKTDVLHGTILLKVLLEESSSLHVDLKMPSKFLSISITVTKANFKKNKLKKCNDNST